MIVAQFGIGVRQEAVYLYIVEGEFVESLGFLKSLGKLVLPQ